MRSRDLDMFDVATGDCHLGEYLLSRYSEMDLQTEVHFDPEDRLEEIKAPRPEPPQPQPQVQEPDLDNLVNQFHEAAQEFEQLNQFQQAAQDYQDRNQLST